MAAATGGGGGWRRRSFTLFAHSLLTDLVVLVVKGRHHRQRAVGPPQLERPLVG